VRLLFAFACLCFLFIFFSVKSAFVANKDILHIRSSRLISISISVGL